jgi:F-type H+-transporting ATPase subunit a
MRFVRLLAILLLSFTLIQAPVFAQEGAEHHGSTEHGAAEAAHGEEGGKKVLNVAGEMFSHVGDAHTWHITGPVSIPLPVIVYSETQGLQMFSSSAFGHHFHKLEGTELERSESANGFYLERGIKEKIIAEDGSKVYDFSITKNVIAMLLSVALLLWIMLSIGKKYKREGASKAPSGFQNAVEPVITFIRDEVAKPNLGYKYMKFMPLLLTIFFFIWINNLLGLLPLGFNFTGNIAVTLCLAIVSFIVMLVNANKHFWSHLLNPPGVPQGIKQLLVLIEIISLFVKPIALTIRLFANILAGHIIILSVVFMIFIFANINTGVGVAFAPVSVAFSIFMFMIELLVAAIQAFIFTNLTAVFIGQAIEEAHHHDDASDHHGEIINEQTGQDYHVSPKEVIA